MTQPGTAGNPLRVAIIGAGPTGFYTAEHLLKQVNLNVEIDLFDRVPTPFGLVRARGSRSSKDQNCNRGL